MTKGLCRLEGEVEPEDAPRFVPSIRPSRRPRSPDLRALYDQLASREDGTVVTGRGWPTFLCQDRFGYYAVWVKKHPGSTLSREQRAAATLLSMGGCSVYAWDPDSGELRSPWATNER